MEGLKWVGSTRRLLQSRRCRLSMRQSASDLTFRDQGMLRSTVLCERNVKDDLFWYRVQTAWRENSQGTHREVAIVPSEDVHCIVVL